MGDHDSKDQSMQKSRMRANIRKCHVNLGHPSRERFIHMLKSANASEEAIAFAKKMECSTCSSQRLQELRGVAEYKTAKRFHEQVCMDTFELPVYQQKKKNAQHCLRGNWHATPLWRGAKASEVRRAYRKYWLRWAGRPRRVLTGGGHEFDAEMQEGLDRDGTMVDKWQNAIAERGGGTWKCVFEKSLQRISV
eukprot:s1947_g8.t1